MSGAFERIAAPREVVKLQPGGTAEDRQGHVHVAAADAGGVAAQYVDLPGGLQQRNRDRLGKAAQLGAVLLRR